MTINMGLRRFRLISSPLLPCGLVECVNFKEENLLTLCLLGRKMKEERLMIAKEELEDLMFFLQMGPLSYDYKRVS
ncbi:hypothetical protein L1887_08845 [Cichorium endivia]|nr:hypothetical protein L1887_08845 [Cichorium endivia]